MKDFAQMQREAAELQVSPTMSALATLAQGIPINVTDKEDLNSAICTTTVALIRAIDAGRIHFDRDEDAAMLHGLLLVALQIVFDGQFAQGAEPARIQ